MSKNIFVPAITQELSFMSRHWETAEEILDQEKNLPITELTQAVLDKACNHADVVFRKLEDAVSVHLRRVLRITWKNTNRGWNWSCWGQLYMPRGRTRIGSAGLWLGTDEIALRLVGWVWPKLGGLDGRRELVRICQRKVRVVCLPSEHPEKYPSLTEEKGILWLDEQLNMRISADELATNVGKQARSFFKVAKPVLQDLANE